MIAITTNIAVFISLFTAFLLHLRSRHSHSYVLMLGYFVGACVLVHQVVQMQSAITFGLWGLVLILIGIGELIRFTKAEKLITSKVDMVRRRKGLHYRFDYFLYNYSAGKADYYLFQPGIKITKLYETTLSCTLLLECEGSHSFDFTPEDFDVKMCATGDVQITPHNPSCYYTAMSPIEIKMEPGASIEMTLRKRQ